ncbi:MAG: hypothetical protein ACYDCN_15860 [Bacteroidia bacterium]
MKKFITVNKWKKHLVSRSNNEKAKKVKKRRIHIYKRKVALHEKLYTYEDKKVQKTFIRLPAPVDFTFIDNTDNVLEYLRTSEKHFKQNRGVIFDKSDVNVLTSDTIALFSAFLSGKQKFRGNSPKKENLKQLFEESGFYNHVRAQRKYKDKENKEGNLLHKESNNIVSPDVAGEAVIKGIKHTGLNLTKDSDPVYNTLIECMQNTNNHASGPSRYGNCNWWLYVYNDPTENITKYSFVDLGVGIFTSLVAKGFVRKFFKTLTVLPNIKLVDDFLNGNIVSREEKDNEIRGKGIVQIIEYAKSDYFKRFYIIANDIKINVKTDERWQLNNNMDGTFLYWELQNSKKNGN